jgi:hypothetical protein
VLPGTAENDAIMPASGGSNKGGGGHGGGGHGGGGHSGHGGGGHGSHGAHGSHGSHGGNHGATKGGASRYRSRDYRGWTRYCWFPRYGCYGYYSPDDDAWYYWYGPDNRYRPVSDMDSYPPDNSVNKEPPLPPGAVAAK